MASKRYDKEPATRPKHIPQNVSVGGVSHVTVYHGGYYCYMDPLTSAYIQLTAAQMMIDAHSMRAAGYGSWNPDGTPVRHGNPLAVLFWILGCQLNTMVIF